jgi:ferredoxin-NADP reductase
VMLAQGVGITPMRSMLSHIALNKLAVHSSLIHVANVGHAYREQTEKWATSAAYPHHAQEFRAATAEAARAHPHATFFVAGASPFVSSTAGLLRNSGIAGRQIRRDKYLFYKPSTARQ